MINYFMKALIKNGESVNDSTVRKRVGIFAALVGIGCNILLFAVKIFAGMMSGAVSLFADAANNLSDVGSSVVTLLGFKLSSMPADKEHPFGHGRMEYISGFVVSVIIVVMGFELLKTSAQRIRTPEEITVSGVTIGILILSVCLKFWMSHFQKKIGKHINSPSLVATAKDSLSDVLATSAVLIGILVFRFFQINIDGWMGIVVALFILSTGFQTAKETLDPLLGQPPEDDFVQEIAKEVLSFSGILGVHDLIVHNYGPQKKLISLHAEVSSQCNIIEIHGVIDTIEEGLKEKFDCEAVIHMDPIVMDDALTNSLREQIIDLVLEMDSVLSIHDFRMVPSGNGGKILFDLSLPMSHALSEKEVYDALISQCKEVLPEYELIVKIDRVVSPIA